VGLDLTVLNLWSRH